MNSINSAMHEIQDNFYRGHHSSKHKKQHHPTQNYRHQNGSRDKFKTRQQFTKQIDQMEENNEHQELKTENIRLKKMLKQAQTKRTQITRECSEITKKMEMLEEQNQMLMRKVRGDKEVSEGEKFRVEQLKFLNKQLNTEIELLRKDNEELNEKLRYQTQIIQRKYEDLQERTFKRIEQAMKRVKKGIHYLGSLTAKEIDKTREIQVQNLKKTVEILRGKYIEDKYEEQIEQLMNPIKNIQEQLHSTTKQLQIVKQENEKLNQELRKHKKVERELMPQYREAIEKLKKNLWQMRTQLSENQYDKSQLKAKYEEKVKQSEFRYDELFKQHRKMKLENKIYEKKLEEMEADVEEEKGRLLQENQLLKKLYEKDDQSDIYEINSGDKPLRTQTVSHKTLTNTRKPEFEDDFDYRHNYGEKFDRYNKATIEAERPKFLKKNFSTSNLRDSGLSHNKQIFSIQQQKCRNKSRDRKYEHLRHSRTSNLGNSRERGQRGSYRSKQKLQLSDCHYDHNENLQQIQNEQSSMFSQQGIKKQIFIIDQEIMEIQKTLAKQLEMHK